MLVLTAPIGGGHDTLARAIATRLIAEGVRADVRTPLVDSGLFQRLPALYHLLTTRFPAGWCAYYYARQFPGIRSVNRAVIVRQLRKAIAEGVPADSGVILLTSSMYCHGLPDLKRRSSAVVVLVADLFGGPGEWFTPGADLYVVPSYEMRAEGLRRGVPAEAIIARRYSTFANPRMVKVRHQSEGTIQVLLVGGADGVGPIESVLRGILQSHADVAVTVVCGRNRRLRERLLGLDAPNVRVDGYRTDLAEAFSEYQLVVTKPGSLSLMEILDSEVPFMIMPGNAGVERENTRRLTDLGIPILRDARTAKRVFDSVERADGTLSVGSKALDMIVYSIKASLPQETLDVEDLVRLGRAFP